LVQQKENTAYYKQDKARKKAEISKLPEDVLEWRKETAKLRQKYNYIKKGNLEQISKWSRLQNRCVKKTQIYK
jgi:hypothetical protein